MRNKSLILSSVSVALIVATIAIATAVAHHFPIRTAFASSSRPGPESQSLTILQNVAAPTNTPSLGLSTLWSRKSMASKWNCLAQQSLATISLQTFVTTFPLTIRNG